jgi:hypothetical protein
MSLTSRYRAVAATIPASLFPISRRKYRGKSNEYARHRDRPPLRMRALIQKTTPCARRRMRSDFEPFTDWGFPEHAGLLARVSAPHGDVQDRYGRLRIATGDDRAQLWPLRSLWPHSLRTRRQAAPFDIVADRRPRASRSSS